MVRFWIFAILVILTGVVGGTMSHQEKKTGEMPFGGLMLLMGLLWILDALFFTWVMSDVVLAIVTSVPFVVILVLCIVKRVIK